MNITFKWIALAILVASPLSPKCLAEDWTEFRGPDGQGKSSVESLPTTWSDSQNIRWKVPLEGDGWSSPVIADGRIYLTAAVPVEPDESKARSLRALCLDAADGTTVWQQEVFRQGDDGVQIHSKNSHASPTPVLAGDKLFVHFGPHGTACLTTDGEVVWKTQELSFKPTHGNGGSPVLHGGTLIVTCDGADQQFVAGISAATGDVNWKTDRRAEVRKGFSFCTPTLIEVGGRVQAICPGSGAVVAYDPQTGKEIWSVDYDEGYSVVPRPVFAGGLVFVSSGYDSATLYAIDPTGKGDVTETHVRWVMKKGIPKTPSMVAVGDELYLVDDAGVASCVDLRTGELHWKQRLGGKFSASVFYGGGSLYFQSEGGETTVVAPGTEFKEVATNQIADGGRTFASFAVVGNDLLLRSEKNLYRIGG